MKKIFLLLFFALSCFGVQRNWTSASSTDMNLGTNYNGSGGILSTDTLLFNATSIVNATATANIRCASLKIDTSYHGVWSMGTYDLTTDYDQLFYGHKTTTTITINGNDSILNNGKIFFDSTVKTLTISALKRWYFGGNDTVNFNRSAAVFMYGQHITLAQKKKTVIKGNSNLLGPDIKGDSTPIILGDSSTLRLEVSSTIENQTTGFGPFTLGAGAKFESNSSNTNLFKITSATSGIKQIIPKLVLSDSFHQVSFQNPVAIDTMVLTDTVKAKNMQIVTNTASANLVFKTMGYPILLSSLQGYLYMGCSNVATTTNKIFFSTSTVRLREITDTGSWNYSGLTVNWDTANVRWSTNLAYSSNHSMVPGRSKFLCDSTENSLIRTRNHPFWDLTVNKSSHTARFKMFDSLKANDSINFLGGVDSLLTVNCAYLHVGGTDSVIFTGRVVCSTAIFDINSKPIFKASSDTLVCLKCAGIINNSDKTLPPIKYPLSCLNTDNTNNILMDKKIKTKVGVRVRIGF